MNLLAELPDEDFYQAITPFYWKERRKPVINISQDAANGNCDRFEPGQAPLGIQVADQTNNSPPKADSDVATLNKQKQEFMEMKTTGAEIIVATFKYAPPIELAA